MLEHLPEYHEQITALDLYCRRHCEPLHGARLGRRDRRLHLHSFDGRHGLADQHVIAAGDGDGDDSSPRHCATSFNESVQAAVERERPTPPPARLVERPEVPEEDFDLCPWCNKKHMHRQRY